MDGDLSEPGTSDRIISSALGRFGRIDTLVNNADVFISKPFTDYTADDYAAVVGANLAGFFTLTQRAIAEMLKQGHGHIVNITATLADYADSSTPSVLTSLTKGGIASATRALGIEYASRGIRVNAVSPGIIQTPVHPTDSYAGLGARLPPVGHVAQVSDIVDGILFLESSPFITGEILAHRRRADRRPLTTPAPQGSARPVLRRTRRASGAIVIPAVLDSRSLSLRIGPNRRRLNRRLRGHRSPDRFTVSAGRDAEVPFEGLGQGGVAGIADARGDGVNGEVGAGEVGGGLAEADIDEVLDRGFAGGCPEPGGESGPR